MHDYDSMKKENFKYLSFSYYISPVCKRYRIRPLCLSKRNVINEYT